MAQAGASPLVGRAGEIAALVAAVEEARAGQPRCVVVTGEAGMGKTRLVSEVLDRLEDALVLTGHAVDMSTGEIPFGVLADTLRDLHHQLGADSLTPPERATLGSLLPGGEVTGPVERGRVLSSALDLLARLSANQLVAWLVEDLHWADAATRDLLNVAMRSLPGSLLVVATVRTGDPARSMTEEAALAEQIASFSRIPHARRVDLRRLTEDQVLTLVRALGGDLPPEAVRAVMRFSDGVPFAVEELAAAQGLPGQTSMARALRARLSRLSPEGGRLAEATAIGDGHLRISLLEQVVDIPTKAFDAVLSEAVESGLLTCRYATDHVGFRHALLRETVDAATGPVARRTWHRRWAVALETQPGVLAPDPVTLAIAEHWHLAGDVTRSVTAAYAALGAARRTGDDTYRAQLWQRIIENFEQRDPSTQVGQLTWRQAVGEALHHSSVGHAPESLLDAVERHPLTGPEQALIDLERGLLGVAKTHPTDKRLVLRVANDVDWLTEPPDELTRTALAQLSVQVPTDMSDLAESFLRKAEALAREAGDRARLIDVFHARSHRLANAGDPAAAIDVLQTVWGMLGPDNVSEQLGVAGDLAWYNIVVGRHHAAEALLDNLLSSTPHLEAMPAGWEHLVENAAFNWLCLGRWATARQVVESAAPWWYDDLRLSSLWLAQLDVLEHGQTDEEKWAQHLGAPISDGPDEGDIRGVLALAAGARGDLGAMRSHGAAILNVDSMNYRQVTWRSLTDLSRAEADAAAIAPRREDRAEAAEHLERLSEALSAIQPPLPHDRAAAVDVAAQVNRFHGRDARPALEAALAAWSDLDHVPDVAVTHLSLAEAHAEAGARDTAREHLAEGRRLATDLDAGPWLDRATAVAHRFGFTTRDRRPEDVLTTREAEVLALLAEGATNTEIADTLVISPKTASVHVSRIIAKTGAGNRTEAVAIARRHGLLGMDGR